MNPIVFFCLFGAAVAVQYSGDHVVEGVGSGLEYPVADVPFVRAGVVPETYKSGDFDYTAYDRPFTKKAYPQFFYQPYYQAGFRKSYPHVNPFYQNFESFNYPEYHGVQQGYKYPFEFYQTGRHSYPYPTGHQFTPYPAGQHYYPYPTGQHYYPYPAGQQYYPYAATV
ncbi:uncharacterized protein LOC106669024 [Cimex lectularius]|uniref:CPR type cuticle protein n=1 Tax=Cimex lectularius TaxID=79782 RepID=A0A8I6SV78_CIMLE|nr:uncharacterized protein LOC106669024 [Cimex lectularius]